MTAQPVSMDSPSPQESGIAEAIRRAGGHAALAAAIDVSRQVVAKWEQAGSVPPGRAPAIEDLTGVSRERLAPGVPFVIADGKVVGFVSPVVPPNAAGG